jgi:hypothetical protein
MPAYDELQLAGYLEGLRMNRSQIERVKGFIGDFKMAMGAPPEYVFVENPVDPLGSAEFTNLILLSGSVYLEFSLNQPNDTITILNTSKHINRIVMPVMQQVSFGEIKENSRLTVQILNDLQVIGFFMASGANCGDLLEVVKRYFIPAISG